MSNLKKPTIIILSLVLFYPLLIILLWSVILGSILLSKNDYLNGTSRYSGDERLYAEQAMKMAMYHEGSHIIPAGASFVYVKEIKYQKSDKLCINNDFTDSPKKLYGEYSAKVVRFNFLLFPKDEVLIGCGKNDFVILSAN